jgi:hypothetical protein
VAADGGHSVALLYPVTCGTPARQTVWQVARTVDGTDAETTARVVCLAHARLSAGVVPLGG